MKATLKIKNFGPISDLDIIIKKFNVLIGPQAAGKSTISKVLCVIHSFDYIIASSVDQPKRMALLIQFLAYYRIENFYKENTYLFFEDESFSFELNRSIINIQHKNGLEKTVNQTESYYFPAERIALPMISESLFELTFAQSTLPQYFLQFGKDFTVARKNQQLFNLPILNVEFQYTDGKNMVYFSGHGSNTPPITLEETSSAIQAILPLLIILQYPVKAASVVVIEELELHGFPTLQKQLLYYITENMNRSRMQNAYVMLPTHSPYVLSAMNNLLFADKVGSQHNNANIKANEIIPKNSWVNKDKFSAYYIKDGTAKSIVNGDTGLIDENKLDSISEDLADEFEQLMALYKPATT